MRVIGILGGTFDPIHFGHLRIGLELLQDLSLDELRFIPAYQPPHRGTPTASGDQRLQMLRVATSDMPRCVIDEREYHRQGRSYTIDTLLSLRQELGNDIAIALIVGSDSFQSLDTWHRWTELIKHTHIVIACRPGWQNIETSAVGRQLATHFISDPSLLKKKSSGYVLPWNVTQLAISATAIRAMIKQNKSPRFLLPDSVLDIINSQQLYRS